MSTDSLWVLGKFTSLGLCFLLYSVHYQWPIPEDIHRCSAHCNVPGRCQLLLFYSQVGVHRGSSVKMDSILKCECLLTLDFFLCVLSMSFRGLRLGGWWEKGPTQQQLFPRVTRGLIRIYRKQMFIRKFGVTDQSYWGQRPWQLGAEMVTHLQL